MKTYAQRFLAIIKALVGCSIYVWGGNGEDLAKMTDTQRMAYYRKHETEGSAETIEKNIARDEALFQKMKAMFHMLLMRKYNFILSKKTLT